MLRRTHKGENNMKYTYNTQGTCSKQIIIDVDDNGIIEQVTFIGGCNGNTKGISKLVKGMKIDDVINISGELYKSEDYE